MKPLPLGFLQKLAFTLVSLIALGYLAILGHTILAPLLTGLLLAIVLLPLCNLLENKLKFGRSLASIIGIIAMIGILYGIFYVIGTQAKALINDWPTLKQQVLLTLKDLQNWVSVTFHVNAEKQTSYITKAAEDALSTGATILTVTFATLSSTFVFFAFTLLFTVFILTYRAILKEFILKVFNEEHSPKVYAVVIQVRSIIKQFIIGLAIQMGVMIFLLVVVLSLLGVKYAFLLGIITGLFNIVPYIGIFISLLLAITITFATAGGAKVLLVIITYVAVHAIDANLVMPLVVGSKVKINALIAFIGIIVGEMMWGISGMFLCLPYLAIVKIIFDTVPPLQPWGLLMSEKTDEKRSQRHERLRNSMKLRKRTPAERKLEEPPVLPAENAVNDKDE